MMVLTLRLGAMQGQLKALNSTGDGEVSHVQRVCGLIQSVLNDISKRVILIMMTMTSTKTATLMKQSRTQKLEFCS